MKRDERFIVVVVVAAIVGLSSSTVDAAIVQFRKAAQCSGGVVTLGDVADVRDADADVAARLSKIVLAPSPAAGNQLRLEFDAVRSRLQAQGIDVARTEFGGATCIVVTSGETATSSKLASTGREAPEWKQKRAKRLVAESISQYLRAAAPELGATVVSFELSGNEVDETLLGAATGYQVRGGAAPWSGPQVFQLRFLDRREQIHSVAIRATVSSQPQVLAAKYNIPRGHIVQAEDLQWQQGTNAGETCVDVRQLLNRETTRMLRANEAISPGDVRATPLIRANDIVTVYANSPGMNIKRRMKARDDGAMDEMVTLISLDGKQSLTARVIGYHEAEIAAAPATNGNAHATSPDIVQAQYETASPPRPAAQRVNEDTSHRPQRPSSLATGRATGK